MNKNITIEFNGLNEKISEGMTISDLIVYFKEGDPDLIVERNGKYIYPKNFSTEKVTDGDSIEFINPNLGG